MGVTKVTDGILHDNYLVDKGSTFYICLNVKDSEGLPLDLSSTSDIKFTVRKGNFDTGEVIFEASKNTGDLQVTGNKIEVTKDASVFDNCNFGIYNFSCKAYDSSDKPWINKSILKGFIELAENTQQRRIGEI